MWTASPSPTSTAPSGPASNCGLEWALVARRALKTIQNADFMAAIVLRPEALQEAEPSLPALAPTPEADP